MGEVPLVRWDAGQGCLVVDDAEATSAQQAKVREILGKGLIRRLEVEDHGEGFTMTSYRVLPVWGCKQPWFLTHTRRAVPGEGRPVDSFTCDCQAFRGTRSVAARACSHVMALSRYVRGEATGNGDVHA